MVAPPVLRRMTLYCPGGSGTRTTGDGPRFRPPATTESQKGVQTTVRKPGSPPAAGGFAVGVAPVGTPPVAGWAAAVLAVFAVVGAAVDAAVVVAVAVAVATGCALCVGAAAVVGAVAEGVTGDETAAVCDAAGSGEAPGSMPRNSTIANTAMTTKNVAAPAAMYTMRLLRAAAICTVSSAMRRGTSPGTA